MRRWLNVLLLFSVATAASALTFDLPATDGARHTSEELAASRAVVFVFLAADCPISNRYSPALHQIEADYRDQGVRFFAVFSGASPSAPALRDHLRQFSLDMPGLLDPAGILAKQTGAAVTPEVALVSPAGSLVYRGRIDNRYVSWGKTRATATENDLRDALDAVLAGHAPRLALTKTLGCAIPDSAAAPR